ncbi:hypothetical protein ACEPPN_002957 [Leptodophora sp. 'Broadleaf-Isolate-01']
MESKSTASPMATAADAHNNEEPPPYLEPGASQATPGYASKAKAWIARTRFSHVWFLFWNLAAIILAICVLNGCGSPSTASHSLINSEGRTLGMMLGGENCDFCDLTKAPDRYMLGLSGACKITNSTRSCSKAFPFSFNLASVVLKDIGNGTTEELFNREYQEFTYGSDIPYDTVGRIAIALGSLLIVSVLVGCVCMGIAVTRTSGFSETLLLPLILDAALHITCLGLYLSILVYEVIRNYSGVTMSDTPLTAFVGVGAWLLVAMFGCRVISHPLLTLGFFCLCGLALLPLFIVIWMLMCCCSSDDNTTKYSSTSDELVRNRPQSQFMVAEATEVEIEHRKDGTMYTRMRSSYAMITNL